MKTTIEIADDLFERAQRLARKENTTFRALTEQGLRLILDKKKSPRPKKSWKPIIRGGGFVTEDFEKLGWDRIRDEFLYPIHRP